MKVLGVVVISFLSFSWSADTLVRSSGDSSETQLDFSAEDILVFAIDMEVAYTVGSRFDSDNFELSVDAAKLLDDDEELDNDNFL